MEPLPPVRYAKSGEVYIAFAQDGPVGAEDVVLVSGATATMDGFWGTGTVAAVAGNARVTWFDKRGLGRSDGAANFSFEERMDDIRAVMDEAGIASAHLAGSSEGGPMCVLFAATYPERVKSLTLYGTFPAWMKRADYPHGLDMTLSEYGRFVDRVVAATLGDVEANQWLWEIVAPSYADDEDFVRAAAARYTESPAAVRLIWENMYEVDVRHVLSSIQAPTTIVHKTGDRLCPIGGGRYLAEHIPRARFVEIPGVDHAFVAPVPEWTDAILEHVVEIGTEPAIDADRRLATVLFTDIVDSTPTAARAGDHAWRQTLDRHDSISAALIAEHQGELIKTTGDGVLATFDGPSRAVRCAGALHDAVSALGIPIRAGLHTGEIEVRGDDIAGLGVHIASRVAGLAAAGETLVSGTVKDLVTGAGFEFDDQGNHPLKGIEGKWQMYALAAANSAPAQ